MTTGINNEGIQIRAINPCGSSYFRSPAKYIPISRPAPTLSITSSSDFTICSGSRTFGLTGLPTMGTTVWDLTNNYGVAGKGNGTNTSIDVNKISNGSGYETLSATVSDCITTYDAVTAKLTFGSPAATYSIFCYLPLNTPCYETDAFYIFRPSLLMGDYSSSYQWSYRVNGSTNETIVNSTGEDGVFIFSDPGTYDIMVRPVNNCGTGNPSYTTINVIMSGMCGNGFNVQVFPNPADAQLTVATTSETTEIKNLPKNEKVLYQLVDLNSGNTIKQWLFDNSSNVRQLNVSEIKPGQYVLAVIKGKYKKSTRVTIK